MSSSQFVNLCSDDEIGYSNGKYGEKRPHSVSEAAKSKGINNMKEACQKSRKRTARHEPADDDRCPNNLNLSRNNFFVLNQEGLQVDESRSSYLPSLCRTPICRQFWKAGNYGNEQSAKAPTENGKNHLLIHPEFLHSNATSHKWVFGAIAELLDNAVDEIQNGATFVAIDKIINPRDGSPALLIQDNGGGMDPEAIRHCMSFGFSDKKQKCVIGRYGNGFKTSSMRLGADVIVFTRHPKKRTLCQSVGLLSYTFLRRTSHDRIVVPMVDYELNASTRMFDPIHYHSKEQFSSNLSVLLQWSPYSAEEMLLKQFDDIGNHGTKIVIYNLWLDDNDDMELDFNFDAEDICMNAGAELFQIDKYPNPVKDEHIANLYPFSLRVYASILYLRLPESFQIILRGRAVKHHNIASDLKFPEFVLYKPQIGGTKEAAALTTIGFLKEAPGVNVHGFNIYHRNRLILPFWRVVKNTTNSTARGVVGVLEANFIEPTHDKQDFEKTSLFQKLEARLKQMTMEYWHLHYGLIGYQLKETPPASVPYLGPPLHNSTVQPVLLNPVTSIIDHPKGPISLPVESPQDPITTLQYVSGERIKRKKNYSAMASEPRKLMGSGSHSIDSQENGAGQPSNDDETQTQNEERSLREENKRLQSRLLELERKEDDLNLKVQQLQVELGEVQQEYARILTETQSIQLRKIVM